MELQHFDFLINSHVIRITPMELKIELSKMLEITQYIYIMYYILYYIYILYTIYYTSEILNKHSMLRNYIKYNYIYIYDSFILYMYTIYKYIYIYKFHRYYTSKCIKTVLTNRKLEQTLQRSLCKNISLHFTDENNSKIKAAQLKSNIIKYRQYKHCI